MTYTDFKETIDDPDMAMVLHACKWFKTQVTTGYMHSVTFYTFYIQPIDAAREVIVSTIIEPRIRPTRTSSYITTDDATFYVYNTMRAIQAHDTLYAHLKKYKPGVMSMIAIVNRNKLHDI